MRYAIYYTPGHLSRFERLGAGWLGRDAFLDCALAQPPIARIDPALFARLTDEPRRYGFHATLKAPFQLVEGVGEDQLVAAFAAFAEAHAAFIVHNLKVVSMKGFLAIVPDPADPVLEALAAAGVREFDRYRAPQSADELAHRRKVPLSARQDELLVKWGYPYVLDEFRFHLTLSERITDQPTMTDLKAAAEDYFAAELAQPMIFDHIGLFVEREPGGPFSVLSSVRLIAEKPETARTNPPA